MKKDTPCGSHCFDCISSSIIKHVRYACVVIILVCIICFAIVFLHSLFSYDWTFSPSKEGVKRMVDFWSDYANLFKLLIAATTILIADVNLKKFSDTEAVKALSDIRGKLAREELVHIHDSLISEEEKRGFSIPDSQNSTLESCSNTVYCDVLDYLGTIELGAIMLQKGLISLEDFNNQFGYRIQNIRDNKQIMAHLEEYKIYYDAFFYALHQLDY